MKFRIALLALILFLSVTSVWARKIKGHLITRRDGEMEVVLDIPFKFLSSKPNFEKLQYRVKVIDENGKTKVFRADDLHELRFSLGKEEYRMLSRWNDIEEDGLFRKQSYIMLKLEMDGKVRLFRFYQTRQQQGFYNPSTGMTTGGGAYLSDALLMQKGEGRLFRPRGLTYRKEMSEYFQDCPELVKHIQERDFRKHDLQSIVLFYNNKCSR